MSDSERITLEGQAVKEILKDARRSKEIYKDFGALALQKRDVLPNKRFLNNTLVSTLRHSYRQDLKGKDGSERKYKQHMASRRRTGGRNRFRAEHDDFQREGEPENVDYGEFDAIKYSDQCTGLYIRDSRRKHAQMSDNFVEKTGKSDSESEKSFTEYDDPPPPSAKEEKSPPPPAKVKRWKHDKFEAKWSDTGSADDYTSDRDDHHGVEDEAEPGIVDQKLRSEYRKYEKLRKKKIDITQPSTSRDYESYEDNEDSDESDQDEKSVKKKGKIVKEVKVSDESAKNSSASEEESNKNVSKKVVKKSKKVKKLPVAGKDLAEIISKRSMYADMEELRERGTEMGDDKHKSRGKKSRREHNAVLIEDSEAEMSAKIENKSSFRRHNSPDDYVRKYPGRTAILYDDKEGSPHSSPRSSNFHERGNYRHERDGTPPRFQRGRGRSHRFHGHLGHEYRGRGRGFERGRHSRMDDRQFKEYERQSASHRSPEYHRERRETESREHSSEKHKRQYSSENQSEERYSRDRLEHRSPGNGRHSEERHKRGRSHSYEKQDKKYLRGSSKDKDIREKHRRESERDERSDFEKDEPVDISELGIPYKTVGDECKDDNMDRERHRVSEHFRESHFYGRRPYRGRGFEMRGRPFIRGRPFRGRGPFRGGFPPPMMPTMDPFYATFMQEFLKESGFEDWLKKKAKKLRRRHSDSSSSSSRSRSSRRRSRRSRRRRRRHSSSSSRSRSRSRSRSYSRRRHSSSSSRRRSYSRSRSRSYSRSRSRSKSRRDRSRSSSDKSYSRSRSRSRGRRDRSRSKTKDRSYDRGSERGESVEDDYQSGSKSKYKSSSHYEQSSEEENQVNEAVEEILGVKKKHKKVHKTKTKKSKPKPSKQVTNVFLESPAEGEVRVIKKKKKSKTKKGKFKKTFQEAEDIVSSVASSEMINYVADDGEVVDSELEVGEIPDENLENVSSENGVEWSSEEEGEVM